MSKKNLNKAETKRKNKEVRKKEKQKKLIIGIVAAVAAIAVLTVGIVFVKPYVQAKIDEIKQATINPSMPPVKEAEKVDYEVVDKPEGLENSKFTYVDYKGAKMPKELADILNQAEVDNAEACKKNGIALVLGEHQISTPRFEIYYYEESVFTIAKLINQVQENGGQNNTGYDFNKAPADQNYGGKEYETWAEKFTDGAVKSLEFDLVNFERALAAGTQLTETQFREIIQGYESIPVYAKEDGITPDEYIANTCGDGATYEMYAAMIIIKEYANTFNSQEIERIAQGITDSELQKEKEKNPLSHKLASVTLYPIEGEYSDSEIAAIKSKQDIINYAAKRATSESYDAAAETNFAWVSYKSFADTFGDSVADWIFDNKRKVGDIGLVQGFIFPCIICVEELPFESNSAEVIVVSSLFDADVTEEKIKLAQTDIDNFKKDWENGVYGSADEVGLDYAVNTVGIGDRADCRIGNFDFAVDRWIHDPARKYGDTTVITTQDGVHFIYFIKSNKEDLDWKFAVRYTLAQEKQDKETENIINKDYKITARNEVAISKAYAHSNKVMQGIIANRLEAY